MDYWDSSALLKLYVEEFDSNEFRQILEESSSQAISSEIAVAELLCGLHRRELQSLLEPGGARKLYESFQQDVAEGRIVLFPFSQDIQHELELVVPRVFQGPEIPVRALDAIHLGTALKHAGRLIAADKRLRNAASAAGIQVTPSIGA